MKKETLAEVIARKIFPLSTIHSDESAAYKSAMTVLSGYDYEQKTARHQDNFKGPITGVHTQNIEKFWSYLKREIRKFGTNKENKQQIIDKMNTVCFKKRYKNDLFEVLVSELVTW